MRNFKELIKFVLQRSIVLYFIAVSILVGFIDHEKVGLKMLNYLRGSAGYVNQLAEGQAIFSEIDLLNATEYYERITEVMPNATLVYATLGYCYHRLGKYAKAIPNYEYALLYNPNFFGLYFNLAAAYDQNGQAEKAVETLIKGIKVESTGSIVYYNYFAQERFTDELERFSWIKKKKQKLDRGYEKTLKFILEYLDDLKRYDEAYLFAQTGINANMKDRAFFEYYAGKAAFEEEQYFPALNHLNESVKHDPNRYEAVYLMSLAFKKIGKQALAAELLERSKKLDPKSTMRSNISSKELFYYAPLFESKS